MDKSLKQRLLGATVLIALAIIFVPFILSDNGKKSVPETANLDAPPSPDRRFQERTLSLDLPQPGAKPTPSGLADAPVDSDRLATVDTATAPRGEAVPVVDVPASAMPQPAPSASSAASTTAAPAAAPVAVAPAPTPAPAPATEAPAANLPGTAANGSYFVHLGDYGNSKNANDLVATLKKAGYAGFAEPSQFGGKATTRVRVGPFADRAGAEATRLRIAAQSNVRAPASVVQNASDAKPASASAPAAAARASGFAVQLGAFATVDEANKLRDQLRGASYPAFVDKVSREGKSLWRVRVGPSADRAGAEAQRNRIRERLKLEGDVVSNP